MKLKQIVAALFSALAVPVALAGVNPQCPFDVSTAAFDIDAGTGLKLYHQTVALPTPHRQVCLHVVAGDGWMVLGNGAPGLRLRLRAGRGAGRRRDDQRHRERQVPGAVDNLRRGRRGLHVRSPTSA